MNELHEIWNLANGDVEFLQFDKSTPECVIYHEANENNIYVHVGYNPMNDVVVCSVLKYDPRSPKGYLNGVAEQMVNVCLHEEDSKPFYSGELNQTSLRAALYRNARKLGINIKTGTYGDSLYCSLSTKKQFMNRKIEGIKLDETIEVDIGGYSNLDSARSTMFNLAKRKGYHIRTKFKNGMLEVKRVNPPIKTKVTKSEEFRNWVADMPWDTQLPLPDLDMSQGSMVVACSRAFSGVCTFSDNLITKNSYRLCKENNELVLYVKGVVILTFPVTRKTQLKSDNWREIGDVLKRYNVTVKDLV